jgi:hypothetical protein
MSPSISRKGTWMPRLERADRMREAERAFLLDELDPTPVVRAVAEELATW